MGFWEDLKKSKDKGTGIFSWGGAVRDVVGSAGGAIGAAVGSAIPGVGTAIGGAIGGGIASALGGGAKKPKNAPNSFAEGLATGYAKETQGFQMLYINKNQ